MTTPGEATRPLLIFDGDCGFCTKTAQWAGRHLGDSAVVDAWQFLNLPSIGLTENDVSSAAWWRDVEGNLYRGHRAVGKALVTCGGAWKIPGWLCLVPPTSWGAALGYRVVAKYRYRLPGGTPACKVAAKPKDQPPS